MRPLGGSDLQAFIDARGLDAAILPMDRHTATVAEAAAALLPTAIGWWQSEEGLTAAEAAQLAEIDLVVTTLPGNVLGALVVAVCLLLAARIWML